MDIQAILQRLQQLGDPAAARGMARYGIRPENVFGVAIPDLRALAKEIGVDHELARRLWKIKRRETMILASMIDDPGAVDESQLSAMVKDFYDWEVCDQTVMNLIQKTIFAWELALRWCERKEEFVRRAGFVLMARLAVSEKSAANERFEAFFPLIIKHATDERNFVKKAVNWALRQIGKRNRALNEKATKVVKQIQNIDSSSARWIAADALRELNSDAVQRRLLCKSEKN